MQTAARAVFFVLPAQCLALVSSSRIVPVSVSVYRLTSRPYQTCVLQHPPDPFLMLVPHLLDFQPLS